MYPTGRTPLVVRLRDLGPALSHRARATLALDRIRAAAEAHAILDDQQQATEELHHLLIHGRPVPDLVPTVVVPRTMLPPRVTVYGPTSGPLRSLRRLVGRHTGRTTTQPVSLPTNLPANTVRR